MVSDAFNDKEKAVLSKYVSNIDSNIFVLTNLPEVVKGALFARYSRSSKSLKRLLIDEFLSEGYVPDGKLIYDKNAVKKAEAFYDRVLLGFGDDSVAELSGVHIAFERVSNIAAKEIEDRRLGMSPLEKSSRYVYFGKDANGKWPYYKDDFLLSFLSYTEKMDNLFEVYSHLFEQLKIYLKTKYSKDSISDISERAYKSIIKAKALDLLRGLLPASTLTNLGIFGNGRSLEYLITELRTKPSKEMQNISLKAYDELSKVIPSFVKRAYDKHGDAQVRFEKSRHIASRYTSVSPVNKSYVKLVHYDKEAENKILTSIIFSSSNMDMKSCSAYVSKLSDEEKLNILKGYIGDRKNRRHKPGREFENAYYTFEIVSNFGAYRDVHRHRVLTQQRQLLSADLGYDVPSELIGTPFESQYTNALDSIKKLYIDIASKDRYYAQYVVPFAYRIRWYITLNLREAYHLCEIRSSKQGHIDYRKIAQNMYLQIKSVHPALASFMTFMDMNSYDFERIDAEKKLDKKLSGK